MKLLRILAVVSLILSAVPVRAQLFEDKSKREAKELFEKGKKENNDRAQQVHDLCQAAQMQPKEKKYSDACSSYGAGLSQDDQASLASAILAYKSHDYNKAESLAKQVTNFDPKLFGQAKVVLDAVRNARSPGQSVDDVKAAWEKGDFNAVMTLAAAMTTPASKTAAAIYVKDVNMYNAYVEAANKAQNDNPQEAISQLGYAQMLNSNGPVNVKAKMTELQNVIAARNNAKYFKSQSSGSKPGAEEESAPSGPPQPKTAPATGAGTNGDPAKKVNGLLAEARNAEKQGNSAAALSDYAAVLNLQPDNKEAQSSSARLEQAIKNNPAAALTELKSAIRSFYQGQFDDARTALMDYLESPQTAQNPGVADFYLGATLIERSILRTPQAQWKGPSQDALSAFREARKANYNPVRAYVSPTLLKIWDSTTP